MIRLRKVRYGYTNQDVVDAALLMFIAGLCLGVAFGIIAVLVVT